MHRPILKYFSRGHCTAHANTIVNESVLVWQHRNKQISLNFWCGWYLNTDAKLLLLLISWTFIELQHDHLNCQNMKLMFHMVWRRDHWNGALTHFDSWVESINTVKDTISRSNFRKLWRMKKESNPLKVAWFVTDLLEGHRRLHGAKLHHLISIQAVATVCITINKKERK